MLTLRLSYGYVTIRIRLHYFAVRAQHACYTMQREHVSEFLSGDGLFRKEYAPGGGKWNELIT